MGSSLRIRGVSGAASAAPVEPIVSASALGELGRDLETLDEALRRLQNVGSRYSTDSRLVRANVRGGAEIDVGLETSSAAVFQSSGEVNAIATSYSTTEPDWAGSSLSTPTISGIYDGSNGDTTLDFTVTSVGALGDPTIEVRDGGGTLLDTLDFEGLTPNQTLSLSNGLELTLDTPLGNDGDSFSVDVFATVGSAVDPDAAFNGTGDDAPGFEPGESVSAGSFVLNGETINVQANDSINDVIDTINGSAAGVTATFDVATESLVITQDTAGSASSITFGSDSSGFLSAVKLDDGALTPGTDGGIAEDFRDEIDTIASLASVTSGTLTIDGTDIAIDVASDSLRDVFDRIEDETGLRTTVDPNGDVLIRGSGNSSFTLDADDTGLFAALGIGLDTYTAIDGGTTKRAQVRDRRAAREALQDIRDAYNAIVTEDYGGVPTTAMSEIRSNLGLAVGGALSGLFGSDFDGSVDSGIGIDLSGRDENGARTIELTARELSKGLRESESVDLLFGTSESEGLVESLAAAIESSLGVVEEEFLELRGIDVYA